MIFEYDMELSHFDSGSVAHHAAYSFVCAAQLIIIKIRIDQTYDENSVHFMRIRLC